MPADAVSPPVIEISDLSIRSASGASLVANMSFSLHTGEILGIVGESGSGKSVTCRALLGLLPPGLSVTSGAIRVNGSQPDPQDRRLWQSIRRKIFGAVFQEPGTYLNPSSRIGSQLIESIKQRSTTRGREARDVAASLLDAVGIVRPEVVLKQFPHELSGGMQQRVMIALALSGDPPVLIADEVTTALDVLVQRQIVDLLQAKQRERGLAMLMISHDLALVSEICARIIVMRAGEIVEQGETAEVIGNPRHAYTRQMIADHRRFGLDPT